MLQCKDILGLNFRFKGELYYWYIISLSSTVHNYSLFLTLSLNVFLAAHLQEIPLNICIELLQNVDSKSFEGSA